MTIACRLVASALRGPRKDERGRGARVEWMGGDLMKASVFSVAASLALLMASCTAPANRRIQENPAAYSQLSPEQKSLVQHGDVAKGMSKDAVKLAWGGPDRQTKEELQGVLCDKWIYTGYVSIEGYHLYSVRPNAPPSTHFTGFLLAGDSNAGNQVLGHVRDAYFRDGNLVAWDVAQ